MNVEEVKKALGEFAEDFNFAVEGVFIVARAKAFIQNKEAWSEIARRMKTVNAEWISNGKMSHWRVAVSHAVEGSHSDIREKLKQLRSYLDKIIEEMQ